MFFYSLSSFQLIDCLQPNICCVCVHVFLTPYERMCLIITTSGSGDEASSLFPLHDPLHDPSMNPHV